MRDVPLPKAPRCHAGGCHGNGKGGIWLGKEGGAQSCRAAGARRGAGLQRRAPGMGRVLGHPPGSPSSAWRRGNKDAATAWS